MGDEGAEAAGYVVPTYEARPGVAWYHFLHGNVPGHQIDFMYRPEVPQGPLTQQHFGHLARLVKYIEPRYRSPYAFAIGNLSRDDTQYEPGRGGVALLFGLRIHGARDDQGRQDPPFCHAVAAVGRHLDERRLLEASIAFYERLLPDKESQAEGSGWYHTYVRHAENADALPVLLRAYVADFDDLPAPLPSGLGFRWSAEGAPPLRRIVIVHRGAEPFEVIAACAARIAGVLVESDIRWTVISTGRELDVPGGLSVRFVPQREAAAEEAGVRILRLEEVPRAPEEIAEQLFGAREVRISQTSEPRMGWRQLYGKQAPEAEVRKGGEGAKAVAEETAADGEGTAKKRRMPVGLLVGIGVALAIGAAAAVVMLETKSSAGEGEAAPGSAQPVSAEAAESAATEAKAPSVAPVATTPKVEEAPGEEKPGAASETARGSSGGARRAPAAWMGGTKGEGKKARERSVFGSARPDGKK
jgi:hypothetical protein